MKEQFFGATTDPSRAELVAKLDAWDGEPIVRLSMAELTSLYVHIPHWRAWATGPTIPWVGKDAHADIDHLCVPTREEAIEAVFFHIRRTCEVEGMEFDRDEWTIDRLMLVAAN